MGKYRLGTGQVKLQHYYIHPLEGSQFFSLFFGNYEPFRSGEVAFTLPSDYSNASQDFFQILTHRVCREDNSLT